MAAPSKVQDMGEVVRWLEDGRTYQWIVDEYRRRYEIETSISMWAGLRRRLGIDTRIVRDDSLIPWAVKAEHRHAHAVSMLRAEARKRAGKVLTRSMAEALAAWLRGLEAEGTVVHYDPDTAAGWAIVPRRDGIDNDLIRIPERRTGRRNWRGSPVEPEPPSQDNITVRVALFDDEGNETCVSPTESLELAAMRLR